MNWAIDLVEQHQPKHNEASIFGIILYTDAHPHIKKLLNDDDYWSALDEWSGPQWAVYSIRASRGHIGYPEMPKQAIAYMMSVWKEPHANKELLDAFEIESTERLPLLLVLAQDEDGSILKKAIRIAHASVAEAYLSLQQEMDNIAKTIKQIEPKNLNTPFNVNTAVSMAIQNRKDWQHLKSFR